MDEVGDIVRGEIDSSEGARERTKGERTAGGGNASTQVECALDANDLWDCDPELSTLISCEWRYFGLFTE